MAAKKTAKTEPKTEPKPETTAEPQVVGGIAAEDLQVLEGDIDDRMAALLKDHQRMGARPK